MTQIVCRLFASAPSCVHDRFVEVWGDHGGGDGAALLGLHYTKAELAAVEDDRFVPLLDTCWEYNRDLHEAAERGVELNACEQWHRQRLALDLVVLLAEAGRRGLMFRAQRG